MPELPTSPRLPGAPHVYERHDVGADTLHQVVRENLLTFLAAIEAGFAGGKLPSFGNVRQDKLKRGQPESSSLALRRTP